VKETGFRVLKPYRRAIYGGDANRLSSQGTVEGIIRENNLKKSSERVNRMVKKVGIILMVLIMASTLALAGCAPAAQPSPAPAKPEEKPAPPAPKVLERPFVYAVNNEVVTMDPHVNDFYYSNNAQWGPYERLTEIVVQPDGSMKTEPLLAESWKASPDAKTFTFNIRKGVKFTDGTPLNAEAVKWNFERIIAINHGPAGRLPKIEKMQVLDEYTLEITLANPYAPFIEQLTKGPCIISPTAARKNEVAGDWGQKWLHENAVGTGPYLLDKWVKGEYVRLVKNPDYWRGWDGKHLEAIVLRLVLEPPVRRIMVETGEADLIVEPAVDDIEALKRAANVDVEIHPWHRMWMIPLRQRGPLADKKVRQALSHAFDYEGALQAVFRGYAIQPKGPIQNTSWAHKPDVKQYKRDLEKAKSLLAEAGYAGGGFNLTIGILAGNAVHQTVSEILQANLRDIGITLKIQEYADVAVWLGDLRTDLEKGPDIYIWHHTASINDPEDNFRRQYHSSFIPRGNNMMYFNIPRADQIIDRAVATTDVQERTRLYHELQDLLVEEAVCIWFAQPSDFVVKSKALKGYKWHPFLANNAPDYWRLWLEE